MDGFRARSIQIVSDPARSYSIDFYPGASRIGVQGQGGVPSPQSQVPSPQSLSPQSQVPSPQSQVPSPKSSSPQSPVSRGRRHEAKPPKSAALLVPHRCRRVEPLVTPPRRGPRPPSRSFIQTKYCIGGPVFANLKKAIPYSTFWGNRGFFSFSPKK